RAEGVGYCRRDGYSRYYRGRIIWCICSRCSTRFANRTHCYTGVFNGSVTSTACRLVFPGSMGMCTWLGWPLPILWIDKSWERYRTSCIFPKTCRSRELASLGKDTGSAIRPKATESQLIVYTKISLLLLTVLMIVFGFMRTEQSAW